MLRFAKKLGRSDDLLSLALILSLIRIDPDSYLGLNSYWAGNHFRENVTGDSWGYTQTDFHRHILPQVPDIPHLLAKSPEALLARYQEELIADLNELGRYGAPIPNNRDRTYAAYLLNEVGNETNLPSAAPAERNSSILSLPGSTSVEDFLLEEFLKSENSQEDGSELTAEDVDLIEILWKQDVDLGVPRDIFAETPTTSRALETNTTGVEKEHYEKVLKEKKSSETSAEFPSEERNERSGSEEDPWAGLQYIIDSETGEYILQDAAPLETNSRPPLCEEDSSPTAAAAAARISLDQALSLFQFDAEDFSEDKLTDNDFTLGSVSPDEVTAESSSPVPTEEFDEIQQALALYTPQEQQQQEKQDEQNRISDETDLGFDEELALDTLSEELEAQLEEMMQTLDQSTVQVNLPLSRSTSVDQRWNDLASLLNLPSSPALETLDPMTAFGDVLVNPHQVNQVNAPPNPLVDLNANGSFPIPSLESTLTLGSALSTSLNITNQTDFLQNIGSFRHEANPSTYYQESPVGMNASEGFMPSFMNDDELHLMDLAVNDSFPNRGVGNPATLFNVSIALPTSAVTPAVADAASDRAVSSMGSESDYFETNVSDSSIDPAQPSTSYALDYPSSSKLGPYELAFSSTGNAGLDSGSGPSSSAPSVAQKKHHLFGRRSFQDSQSPTPSRAGSSLSNGFANPVTPVTPLEPVGKLENYGAVGGGSYPNTPLASEDLPVPALENVRHNHTYSIRGETGVTQRPVARDKPRASVARSSAGSLSSGSSSGSEAEMHSRDVKRARELNVPISVEDIVNLPMDEFSERLTRYELSEAQLTLIRDIRRRGKNKVAAQNCRKRKMDQIVSLAEEVQKVRDKKLKLERERQMLLDEKNRVKNKFAQLYRHIFQSLRDPSGRPYSSNDYSLQQSADGSILLVPRAAPHGTTPIDPDSHQASSVEGLIQLGARSKTNVKK